MKVEKTRVQLNKNNIIDILTKKDMFFKNNLI